MTRILEAKNVVFSRCPAYTILFYTHPQDIYFELEKRGIVDELIQGYPGLDSITQKIKPYKSSNGSCLIFDDSLSFIQNEISTLFTAISHQYNSGQS